MAWLARTKPHYIVRYACGHIKTSCYCGNLYTQKRGTHRLPTVRSTVPELCPSCYQTAARRDYR